MNKLENIKEKTKLLILELENIRKKRYRNYILINICILIFTVFFIKIISQEVIYENSITFFIIGIFVSVLIGLQGKYSKLYLFIVLTTITIFYTILLYHWTSDVFIKDIIFYIVIVILLIIINYYRSEHSFDNLVKEKVLKDFLLKDLNKNIEYNNVPFKINILGDLEETEYIDKGFQLQYVFNINLPDKVFIYIQEKLEETRGANFAITVPQIETESIDFNKSFNVFSNNQMFLTLFLTPKLMEWFVKFSKEDIGVFDFKFNNKKLVVIETGFNKFLRFKLNKSIVSLKKFNRILEKIYLPYIIIDELKLNEL